MPRDNIVQHAELRRQTVIQYAPDSQQAAGISPACPARSTNNSGQGTIPTPITMEELEDMLLEFGIMKTEEQALAELAGQGKPLPRQPAKIEETRRCPAFEPGHALPTFNHRVLAFCRTNRPDAFGIPIRMKRGVRP